MQLGAEVVELAAQRTFGCRWLDHTQCTRHDRRVRHVLISLVADEGLFTESVVRRQEAVEFGDVHPSKQVRIIRCVRLAVTSRANDAFVHAVHDLHCPLGLGRRPERRRGEKVSGALEPTPRIMAIVGVLGDARHRTRVQGLEQQRAEPTDEHRGVGVDTAYRCVVGEPAGLVGPEQFDVAQVGLRTDDAAAHLLAEPTAHPDRLRHLITIPWARRRAGTQLQMRDMTDDSSRSTFRDVTSDGRTDDPNGRKGRSDDALIRGGTESDQSVGRSDAGRDAGRDAGDDDPEVADPADQAGSFERGEIGRSIPRWVLPAIGLFWLGFLLSNVAHYVFGRLSGFLVLLLISVFLTFAIEPAVARLAGRGWRRGTATLTILLGVLTTFLVFVVAIGTLVGNQIADLLSESETYITDSVDWINSTFSTQIDPQAVVDDFNDPNGRVQEFIQSQGDEAVRLSVTVVGVIFQIFSVLLFTYYLVADGPRLRRVICSRLRPGRQEAVLRTWDIAINKTGGYLYSRALLALLSAVSHWILFQSLGTQAPIALALWVGLFSQFLPVVGTYIAGILPVLVTLLESPLDAVIVVVFIVVYQQVENFLLTPRITSRTMELHPAVAFGAALGGAALLGAIGAVLALPAVAMGQALVTGWGQRYDVVDSHLTEIPPPRPRRLRFRR